VAERTRIWATELEAGLPAGQCFGFLPAAPCPLNFQRELIVIRFASTTKPSDPVGPTEVAGATEM